MNIGILSMQRVINYGSFLQAYGLKKIMENMGHTVQFVDFKIEGCVCDNPKKDNKLYHLIRKIWILYIPKKQHKDKFYNQYKVFKKEFKKRNLKELGIGNKRNERAKVDVLVIGSDEVFNCLQKSPAIGFSMELFGMNNRANRVITYAASCGDTTIDRVEQYGKQDIIKKTLKNIDAFSARDENTCEFIKHYTDKDVLQNIDPVLLYDFKEEIRENVDIRDYILVYAYTHRITEEEAGLIKDFATRNNKKIVCVGNYQTFCDVYISAHPFELLSYVKFADYVITDTFHGTIFSIKYNKKFIAIVRNSNSEKVRGLLDTFSLKDREWNTTKSIEEIINKDIDYKFVNDLLLQEQKKAFNYLQSNILERDNYEN